MAVDDEIQLLHKRVDALTSQYGLAISAQTTINVTLMRILAHHTGVSFAGLRQSIQATLEELPKTAEPAQLPMLQLILKATLDLMDRQHDVSPSPEERRQHFRSIQTPPEEQS